jgi:hypothetical protein
MKFDDLTLTQLKKLIKTYRLHVLHDITKYTQKNKNELVALCQKLFNINNTEIRLKVSEPIKFEVPKGRYDVSKEKTNKKNKEIEFLSTLKLENNIYAVEALFKFRDSLGTFSNVNIPNRGGKQKTFSEEIQDEINRILKDDKLDYERHTKYGINEYMKTYKRFIDNLVQEEAVNNYYKNL